MASKVSNPLVYIDRYDWRDDEEIQQILLYNNQIIG